MAFTVRPFLLALLGGSLIAFAYRVPHAWPVVFVAVVPLLYAVKQAKTKWRAFWYGLSAGSIVMGAAASWFYAVLPLPHYFGVSNNTAGLFFVIFSWTLVTLATALPVGLWAVLVRLFEPERLSGAFAIGVLWTLFEFLRMVTFNMLTYDYGQNNPLFFSVGFLGWPLIDNESLRQFAALGGLYTLSMLAVYVNIALYVACAYRSRRTLLIAGVCVTSVLLVAFSPLAALRAGSEPRDNSIPIAIATFPTSHVEDVVLRRAEDVAQEGPYVRAASAAGADLIVLPEGASLLGPFTSHTAGEYFTATSTAVILDSGGVLTSGRSRPERAYADSRQESYAVRDKAVLTPQGEYLPYLFRLLLRAGGARNAEEMFDTTRGLNNGIGDGRSLSVGVVKANVMFCLEAMQPGLGKRLVDEQGSQLLLLPSSHWLFRPNPALERDTLRFGQLQAVEAERPLASSNSDGAAYVLDQFGRVLSYLPATDSLSWQIIDVPLPKSPSLSP